jgi:chitinase
LCTHIIVAFGSFYGDGTFYPVTNLAAELKAKYPTTKVMIAVGGWTFGSGPFQSMTSNANFRSNFVTSSYNYMVNNGLDGIDLDWEYPTTWSDQTNLVSLIRVISMLIKYFAQIYSKQM